MLLISEATYGIYYMHIMNLDIHCCYSQYRYFYSDKQQTTVQNRYALCIVTPCTARVVNLLLHYAF